MNEHFDTQSVQNLDIRSVQSCEELEQLLNEGNDKLTNEAIFVKGIVDKLKKIVNNLSLVNGNGAVGLKKFFDSYTLGIESSRSAEFNELPLTVRRSIVELVLEETGITRENLKKLLSKELA
ncbi:hypothetical protein KKF38_04475 [Patescibacteria group bacterium]|nr:hypothetical protein [Patescibacteria group bacterium]